MANFNRLLNLGNLILAKYIRPPKDMDATFHTLIHCAPKVEVDELSGIRKQLKNLLGKQFE